jgi:hypothetical protein
MAADCHRLVLLGIQIIISARAGFLAKAAFALWEIMWPGPIFVNLAFSLPNCFENNVQGSEFGVHGWENRQIIGFEFSCVIGCANKAREGLLGK